MDRAAAATVVALLVRMSLLVHGGPLTVTDNANNSMHGFARIITVESPGEVITLIRPPLSLSLPLLTHRRAPSTDPPFIPMSL